jgi:hypothetical protein
MTNVSDTHYTPYQHLAKHAQERSHGRNCEYMFMISIANYTDWLAETRYSLAV